MSVLCAFKIRYAFIHPTMGKFSVAIDAYTYIQYTESGLYKYTDIYKSRLPTRKQTTKYAYTRLKHIKLSESLIYLSSSSSFFFIISVSALDST